MEGVGGGRLVGEGGCEAGEPGLWRGVLAVY